MPPVDINAKFVWYTKLYVLGERFKDSGFMADVLAELS